MRPYIGKIAEPDSRANVCDRPIAPVANIRPTRTLDWRHVNVCVGRLADLTGSGRKWNVRAQVDGALIRRILCGGYVQFDALRTRCGARFALALSSTAVLAAVDPRTIPSELPRPRQARTW
jgi:hypothetical protein